MHFGDEGGEAEELLQKISDSLYEFKRKLHSVYSISRAPRTINNEGQVVLKIWFHFDVVSASPFVRAMPKPADANQRCCLWICSIVSMACGACMSSPWT